MKKKKMVLLGAGGLGAKALIYFGYENVYAFADSHIDSFTHKSYIGKYVMSLEELIEAQEAYRIIICMRPTNYFSLQKSEKFQQIKQYEYFLSILAARDYPQEKALSAFHDCHKGENVFLIGNGPSLKVEDLDVLHQNKCITFFCNNPKDLFARTKWRPDYYFVEDPIYHVSSHKFIPHVPAKKIILCDPEYVASTRYVEADYKRIFYYHSDGKRYTLDERPDFSSDVTKKVCFGNTVMYAMLQFSVFMGFSKVFLLGVDNGFSDGKEHFYEETPTLTSFSPSEEEYRFCERAYESAELFTRKTKTKIYNATRGGKLRAFERVDFDALFPIK